MLPPNTAFVLCPACLGDYAVYNQYTGLTEYCQTCYYWRDKVHTQENYMYAAGLIPTTREAVVKQFLGERMDKCKCDGFDCECGGFAASVLEGIMREEEKENGKRNPVGS